MYSEVFIFIVMFLAAGSVLITLLLTLLKREQARQETLQKAMENGQQLTPELVNTLGKSVDVEARDYRRGVIITLFGVAFLLFGLLVPMDQESKEVVPYFSLFPLFLGGGYLVVWKTKGGRSLK